MSLISNIHFELFCNRDIKNNEGHRTDFEQVLQLALLT